MRIYFDFEIDAANSGMVVQVGEDVKAMMEELKGFVAEKLADYKEDMEKERKGYVRLAVGDENPITYFYPDELAIKLVDCINEEDYRYIMTKIYFDRHQQ